MTGWVFPVCVVMGSIMGRRERYLGALLRTGGSPSRSGPARAGATPRSPPGADPTAQTQRHPHHAERERDEPGDHDDTDDDQVGVFAWVIDRRTAVLPN